MRWDDDLVDPHYAIAASKARRIAVLAGPGTGKTKYGLMRRIARLLQEGVSGTRILLISFTRTASHDLRTKIADLGIDGADEVRATTLHSYCFGLLQRDAVLSITQRTPRPLLEHERDLMLRDLDGPFGDIRDRRKMLSAFEAGWARGTEDHPGLTMVPAEKQFEQQVLRWLRHHRAMLVGEVVPLSYHYLANNPLADDLAQFDHIVVDEYQDMNFLEQRLLSLLATREEASLCVAGDDDQSIYGFRHANPIGIRQFFDSGDVEGHTIDLCGRCPRIVLSMANSLMTHAPDRTKGELMCSQETDGDVAILHWSDVAGEVEGIVAAIAQDVQSDRRSPGDILILVHRRMIGEAFRDRLRELGIPAQSFFTEGAVTTADAQEALALLRLRVGDDPVSLRVLLGLGDATGRAESYRKLSVFCRAAGISEREALETAASGKKLEVSVRAFLQRFTHAVNVIAALPFDDLPAVIDALFPSDNLETTELRALALEVLPDVSSLKELLDALVVKVTQVDVPPSPDYVRIMSLHKSKGLTSPAVFVVGLVQGVVPTLTSRMDEGEREATIEEQRRLLYVAVTRAAEQLVLSHASSMGLALAYSMGAQVVREKIHTINGELRAPTIASQYLSELGPDAPKPVQGTLWLQHYGES